MPTHCNCASSLGMHDNSNVCTNWDRHGGQPCNRFHDVIDLPLEDVIARNGDLGVDTPGFSVRVFKHAFDAFNVFITTNNSSGVVVASMSAAEILALPGALMAAYNKEAAR